MKTCSKCKADKPLTEFNKATKRPDGLRCACKSCGALTHAAYRATNREKLNSASAAWHVKNTGRQRDSRAAYYLANTDRLRSANAVRYAENTEKIRAAHATYRAANVNKVRASNAAWKAANLDKVCIYSHNRRARENTAGGNLSHGLADKLFKLQRGKCACCGLPLGEKYHLDHIMPLALGGANEDWNIQLLRQRCNNQKHAKHPIDFMQQRGFLL